MAYKFDGVEYDFSPMTTQDTLKAKSAMMALSLAKGVNETIEANEILDKMAFKYVTVKDKGGKWITGLDADTIKLYFDKEEAYIDISTAFMSKVTDFLAKSPNFQALQARAAGQK